jgi:hypothetical protein
MVFGIRPIPGDRFEFLAVLGHTIPKMYDEGLKGQPGSNSPVRLRGQKENYLLLPGEHGGDFIV